MFIILWIVGFVLFFIFVSNYVYLLYICKAMPLLANYSISIRTKTILMILF